MVDVQTSRLARARRLLPKGTSLPPDVWRGRHRGILAVLWLHVPVIFAYGLYGGFGPSHSAFEAAVVAIPAIVASLPAADRKVRMVAAAIGIFTASAVLVHLSGGLIEMHFHFFVMVVVITLYQNWLTFLVAVGYVVLHHGIMGVVDPQSVYNHPAAWANPWLWAAVHGGFIAAASAAALVKWRLNEEADERAEEYSRKLFAQQLKQRQALEINDNVVQGLVVAKYSLAAGEVDRAKLAVEATLSSAKNIVGDLIGDEDRVLSPGDLVRSEAVVVEPSG